MLMFVLKRAGAAVLLAIGTIIIAFLLTSILPGDPTTAMLSERAAGDPAIVAALREKLGLDQPLYVQFFIYLGNLITGDLGTSTQTSRPVLTDLSQFAPASAELALFAAIIAIVLGVGLGVVAALFSTQLRLFPSSGRLDAGQTPPPAITGLFTVDSLLAGDPGLFFQAVSHLVLPAFVLSAPMVGLMLRFSRASVLEVLGNDYVRAATAKGLPAWTVVRRHVLRGALVPVITVLGTAFASLLAGTVLVEQIFAWPGIGSYAYRSASNLDLPSIIGVTLFIALVYVVVNFVTDLLYGIIDPRIRTA